METTDLARRLQALRKQAGYSQEQLAALLSISRQAVSKWESGQGKPELDKLKRLAELYHVSTDAILSEEARPALPPAAEKRKRPPTLRRTAAVLLSVMAYPLSLGFSVAAHMLEIQLAQAIVDHTQGRESLILEWYSLVCPLVSLPKAQLFFFISLCLAAVLLFFWDGLPWKRTKKQDE